MTIVQPMTPARTAAASRATSTGFGNGFETEALPGALPIGRNSPQRCAYGLYAEQLIGSPFTAPRATNERSWLYRIRPTVAHWGAFSKADAGLWRTAPCAEVEMPIAPLRWDPIPIPAEELSFMQGIRTITTAGDAGTQSGMAAHVYLATRSMEDEFFYNADGEMLFVPQQGALRLRDRVRHHRRRARRDRRHPARRQVQRRAAGRAGARLPVRELWRRPHPARARPDRRQLPGQPARLPDPGRGLRGPRRALAADREMGRLALGDRARPFAARRGRLARQLRALQIRPAPLLAGRAAAVRPCRPVDLHRADLALGDAGHRQHRLRHLPRPLDGGREHLPAALVPHERHERVHGADLRPLRRQAAGLRAGRHSACTTACCRTARTWTPSRAPATPS